MCNCTGSIFGAYANDCTDVDTIGSGIVYGKGILVDGGSRSGADGSGQSCRL